MKYYLICRMKNIENDAFCKSCGAKFGKMVKTNAHSMETPANQGMNLHSYV